MKYLQLLVLFTTFMAPSPSISASEMSNLDSASFISAVEDYHFGDYDVAILRLETLHEHNPKHLGIMQYLALSYQESGQPKKARSIYKAWISTSRRDTSDQARFAWLGLAQSNIRLSKSNAAIRSLKVWLKAHPDDIQAQTNLGDAYIRSHKYQKSEQIWDKILNSSQSNDADKAAAWYYKGLIAHLNSNSDRAKKFVNMSILLDKEGPYATAAKRLKVAPKLKKQGFYGSAFIENFYNSNIRLVPDTLTSTTHGGDFGFQGSLLLGYNRHSYNLKYLFNATKHIDLSEYDLIFHMLLATWQRNQWKLSPLFQYVSLNKDPLYQAYGLNVFYTSGNWQYGYAGKLKQFNTAFGTTAVDLGRLSGSSHKLSVKTNHLFGDLKTSLSTHLLTELTRGDATHDKSDSYTQLGGSATIKAPLQHFFTSAEGWEIEAKLNMYCRLYAAPDTTTLISTSDTTKRFDVFNKISSSITWKPWIKHDIIFAGNIAYQNNLSNYDETRVFDITSKDYSGYRVGGLVHVIW